jgi:CTP-dependent riboflavin kinase
VAVRRKITGVIFSDLGQAASFMSLDWVQTALQQSLGFSPYPATLNLRLELEKEIVVWQEVQRQMRGINIMPPDASFCQALCFLVEIEG